MILVNNALRRAAVETLHPFNGSCDQISVDVHSAAGLNLEPVSFGTVSALESFDVPTDLACLLTGRSSHMRRGIYMPGGWIDPGKTGSVELEFFNMSDENYYVERGEAAARLVFFELTEEVEPYDGTWQ